MNSAQAEIEIIASTRRLPAALRSAKTMMSGFGKDIEGGLIDTKPLGALGKIGGIFSNAAIHSIAFRGIDMMIEQGKEAFDFQEKLTRFGIAARVAGPQLVEVGAAIRQVSKETGIGANEVLRGARAYVDLAGAGAYTVGKMSLIARAAQASGSDINDMATVVYALQHSLSIPNNELENTIGGLINLSKDGAVHFNQMAQELIGLAPVYAQFGIKGREGAIQLASQLEVVRTGFGSASEAATGLLRLYRSIPQHAKLFEGAGVQIFQKGSRTDMLTFGEILNNIKNSRLEKDRPALIKAFGRGEAERSYQLLDKLLNEYQALEEAGKRNGVVQEDLATYTESASGRMSVAVQGVRNAFAEALTPDRVDQIVSGMEGISRSANSMAGAIGIAVKPFELLYKLGTGIRRIVMGEGDYDTGNPWKGVKEDSDDYKYYSKHPELAWSKEYQKSVLPVRNKDTFEGAALSLMKDQGGAAGKPNETSIRHALDFSKADDNAEGGRGLKVAGSTYLDTVPKDQLETVMHKVFYEALRSGAEKFFSGWGSHQEQVMAEARANYNKWNNPPTSMEVKFDANSGGKAIADAPGHRRR